MQSDISGGRRTCGLRSAPSSPDGGLLKKTCATPADAPTIQKGVGWRAEYVGPHTIGVHQIFSTIDAMEKGGAKQPKVTILDERVEQHGVKNQKTH